MKYLISTLLLLYACTSFAQNDTLITQTITFDTIISIKVVQRITTERSINGVTTRDNQEKTITSEQLVFEDKNASKTTKKSSPKKGLGLGVSVVPAQEGDDEDVIELEEAKMGYYSFIRQDVPSGYAQTITAADLKKHAYTLASDEYEGRETGRKGQRMAAAYIADHFKALGLPDFGEEKTYFQKYPLLWESWEKDGISINVAGQDYKHLEDFYSFPSSNRSRAKLAREEVIFLGYGIDDPMYSDYKKADVKGKIVLIYGGEPKKADGTYYLTGNENPSEWSSDWRTKLRAAKKNGVKTVLIIEPTIRKQVVRFANRLAEPNLVLSDNDPARKYANSCYISPALAKAIMGKKYDKVIATRDKIVATGKPKPLKLKTNITIRQKENREEILAENVLGFIRGADPEVNEEVIVITAHYDHLGKRANDVFNGADDNGSGTSAILEIAEAFATAKKDGAQPRRSILVMAVSGEEKGLLGSEYYADNPVFDLENTVCNLNVDMIGRVDKKHLRNPNYVYVIGADRISTELDAINKAMNKKYTKLELDYTFNAEDDPNQFYYRSDHYNFAEKGVPSAFFFSGVHKDYHQATDTPDKLDYVKMERIARLVFLTAWEIAERENRIISDRN